MNLLKLKVVIWKNFIIRRRHWLLTTFESLLPVVVFFLIAYARSQIKGYNKTKVEHPTYNPEYQIHYDGGFSSLLYVPNTPYYEDIIHRTVVKFQLQSDRVKGFKSEKELTQYYFKNPNGTVLAVLFRGNNTKHLDYVIRYHDEYSYINEFLKTDQLYSKNMFGYSPGKNTDYYWKGFLSLQKAIDMSFIEKNLKKNIDNAYSLYIKEFPYPPYIIDDAVSSLFREYLPLLTLFSFIFICPAVLKRVVEEKVTGTKELLKMVGMKSWMLWLGWFIYGMIPMLFSVILIVIFMKVPVFGSEYPAIEYSDGSVLFCYLLLYCMAANVFCFALSSCFSNPSIAMVTGILLWILTYFVPKYSLGLEDSNSLSWFYNILLNLLPNMSLHYGYSVMSSYEERELGVQWSNIAKASSDSSDDITMLNIFVMLIVDILVYMSFTMYMDKVNPGKYGVRESFLFPLKRLIRCFRRKSATVPIEDNNKHLLELGKVEEGYDRKKCIELNDVYKEYGHKMAVNNLNLNIYKNQITVLLGHNGAGKSTTMSMITGMLEPTSGSICVDGLNIKTDMEEIRSKMGLCPQHNLLFSDLTVEEHLILFAKLKGMSAKDASDEAEELMQKLDIYKKKNDMANTLSGGMKRKLCLGMAVIGNSSVLILDEPSSGMDPESRRELWDLLLKWRNSKTILITTHFMEEADALGDWIAIMSHGHLDCSGTPMFLKKEYDTGYHLSLMVSNESEENINNIKSFITKLIPNSKFRSQNGKNLVFVLPFEGSQISAFLTKLEDEKKLLGIENLSLTLTTLEDVFLKSNKDVVDSNNTDTDALIEMEATSDSKKKEGSERYTLQLSALIMKRFNFFMKKKFNYCFPMIIALVFFLLTSFFSTDSRNQLTTNGPELKLSLNIYKKSSVYMNTSSELSNYKDIYGQIVRDRGSLFFEPEDVESEILKSSMENILFYKKHIISSAVFRKISKEVEAFALFNSFALHSSPISLNLITNTIAKSLLGEDHFISTSNWPLETPKKDFLLTGYSETKIALLWLVMVPLGCLFMLGSFIIFPHTEINSNFIRIQYMCGVKQYIYWAVNYFVDLLSYLLVMLILSTIICTMSAPFHGVKEFGALYFILFLYGLSGIPCAYLFCRKKTASGAFALLVILGMFLGIIITVVVGILLETKDDYYVQLAKNLKIISFLFLPQVGLSYLLVEFAGKAVKNYNMVALPQQMQSSCSFQHNPCCDSLTSAECHAYRSYIAEDDMWWLMLLSAIIYFAINCLWDSYLLRKLITKLVFKLETIYYKHIKNSYDFTDTTERRYIPTGQETLSAKKLFKSYSGKAAVRNININLNKQECLGILGVNGAGKTTTFRMLTRDECLDNGEINLTVDKRKVDIGQDEYLESLGYCPQNDSLNLFLTGREILTTVANLRGIDDTKVIDNFLELFELRKYENIPCRYYSGGNKRKLSLAISLIGFPQFVLLDEPTNGVDPSSRRRFWSLIKNIQNKQNLSFILTSHSMVECEALCNSLIIMKDGQFKMEGPIDKLKSEFGGFSVKLKLKGTFQDDYDEPDAGQPKRKPSSSRSLESDNIDIIKQDVENCFKSKAEECKIKDEHSRLLHYYIKGKQLRWSEIFEEFENLKKRRSDILEDYSISEASLEDVFLKVAREDNQLENE